MTSKKYQTVQEQETKPEHHKFYFNGGFAPAVLRNGNLGVENRNREYRRLRFHKKQQQLALLYERLCLFVVKSNVRMMLFWQHHIAQTEPRIAQEMQTVIDDLFSLKSLSEMEGLSPRIALRKGERVEDTLRRVQNDQLKFAYKHEKWSLAQDLELQRMVIEKTADEKWSLTAETLAELVGELNGSSNDWPSGLIRSKLCDLGIDFNS